ncbi:MAG: undecaprenyl-diphosphate phosphatase [Candidatus Marinimicrobia bacterium]|jgi:undecaprenyl-diphosphatase|nr:undecaprenyl-diphosphate phosphatase [Candidatus Neomarinimicrobiota bacterium]|tara:strand:+ start:109 stop:864 length:756 start_codon:yes stop_codon:yes gene_type:complete
MQYLDTLILSILQGLTEFLPISSSGHLVIGQKLLDINLPGNAFEVVLHIGTLLSVLTVFRVEIKTLFFNLNDPSNRYYISAIAFGTIPALLFGLLLKDYISLIFDNIRFVSLSLVFTGIMLIASKFIIKRNMQLTLSIAMVIGLAQAVAIIPGISRSGATICMGILLGLSASEAARFSFLLSIPVIIGAALLTAMNIETIPFGLDIVFLGILFSYLVGWVSLKWLLNILNSGKLYWFGVYCLIIGLFVYMS